MIEQIAAFFTIEMIYLWLNIGVLPFWFVLIFFPRSNISLAQEKFTLSGFVSDIDSKETLIGVNIIVPELQIGTITNEYGFYSLTLPKGNHILQINYLGYRTKKENIILIEDITKNFGLKQQSEILDEIIKD